MHGYGCGLYISQRSLINPTVSIVLCAFVSCQGKEGSSIYLSHCSSASIAETRFVNDTFSRDAAGTNHSRISIAYTAAATITGCFFNTSTPNAEITERFHDIALEAAASGEYRVAGCCFGTPPLFDYLANVDAFSRPFAYIFASFVEAAPGAVLRVTSEFNIVARTALLIRIGTGPGNSIQNIANGNIEGVGGGCFAPTTAAATAGRSPAQTPKESLPPATARETATATAKTATTAPPRQTTLPQTAAKQRGQFEVDGALMILLIVMRNPHRAKQKQGHHPPAPGPLLQPPNVDVGPHNGPADDCVRVVARDRQVAAGHDRVLPKAHREPHLEVRAPTIAVDGTE
jgi:hypothetical protein